MFGEQPYRHLASGQVDYIADISPENLYHTYQSMLHNDYCAVYVVGNVDEQEVKSQIKTYFDIKPFQFKQSHATPVPQADKVPQEIIETDEVDQAKLNIGFKLPVQFGDKQYFASVVLILCLAEIHLPFCLTKYEKTKFSIFNSFPNRCKNGFMFVLSGVSSDKYEVAKDTIIAEFEKFQQGQFSEEKLELAKKIIISQRQESYDRPKRIIEILNNNILLEHDISEEAYIKHIQDVDHAEIIDLAKI